MFLHNLKYSLKVLFKNKVLLFWTFAFPLILGTLFYLSFRDIENNEILNTIDIAIVENESFHDSLKEVFDQLEDEKVFSITYGNEKEAKELLDNNKISGYFIASDSFKIVVKENGIHQTVLKYVTEEIFETEEVMKQMIMKNPSLIKDQLYQDLYSKIKQIQKENQTKLVDISSQNLSYTMIEFYTLIAMTCLYGGMLGLYVINQNLANQSNNGKRISVGPIPKGKMILSSALAGYIVQLIGIALLFLYTIFVLHIDYGNDFFRILILTLVGCFAGLSMGIMIASVFKTNENTKTGIVVAFTMLGCFLSGMMGITMKYIIDKNIPIINWMNPASMITDGFYALYYYDTLNRYHFNLISLLLFSGLMILISIRSLRRQTYDSI